MAWQANCSTVPAAVLSDAGVAGEGILLSFIITAFVALLLSTSLILPSLAARPPPPSSSGTIRRKLLLGYSDQQLIQGIGLQSVGLAKAGSLVPYHFFLIWMLSLLSMAVHNAALLALVGDFRADWVLRWLWQALMFASLCLSCIYGAFVLQSKVKGLPSTLPIACVWEDGGSTGWQGSGSGGTVGGVDYVGTVVTIAGNCVVFGLAAWYLHNRGQRFYRAVRLVGLVLMAGIAIGATVRILLLSQAFGTPDTPLSDQGEKAWSFGQLLSMLMLVLPLISAVEILRGQIHVAAPATTAGKDVDGVEPLVDGGQQLQNLNMKMGEEVYYQPNPFWGEGRARRGG